MNVLIVEDEILAAERLEKLILEIDNSFRIKAKTDSIERTVKWLKTNPAPDLIFLDIQLADGKSFDIFKEVKVISPVIFTTAYDQYAIQAFELNSIDYLLKPIKREKLEHSINKFKEIKSYFSREELEKKLKALIQNIDTPAKTYKSRFLVHKGSTLLPVSVRDIAYFFADDKLVLIKTMDNQQFVVNYTLDKIESELDPQVFFRVNRSFIVSLDAIVKVHSYFNYKLKLELNPTAPKDVIISKQRAADFKDWLNA